MNNPTTEQLQQHLDSFYITLDALARRADISKTRILEFIDNQCIPPHSYTVHNVMTISDPIMNYSAHQSMTRYYHPSIVSWIAKARTLAENHSLIDVSRRIREQFILELDKKLAGRSTPGCANSEHAWHYFIKGIWGICLQEISVDCIAKKELARLAIANIVNSEPTCELSDAEKIELKKAVDSYNRAVKEFVPHFAPMSSRTVEVEAVVKKYL